MTATVLVVGGYGVVGTQISELLATRHPELKLLIGGRNLEQATNVADRIGGTGIRIDVEDADPLAHVDVELTAVVVAVNDHRDRLLVSAVRRGIAVVDIARWEARVKDAHAVLAGETLHAPVILSSGWLAGVAAMAAAAFRDRSAPAHRIDIAILFALADKAGPDSIAGFIDIHQPFTVQHNGKTETVQGLSDPRTVSFGGRTARCYRLSTPDQLTLVQSGHADAVSARIAFDSAPVTAVISLLVRSGLWAVLPRSVRRRVLYNPGRGAAHHVLVTIEDANGTQEILISDAEGQTHATAAAAVTQVERVLNGFGGDQLPAEISYPEQAADSAAGVETLRSLGLTFVRT